MESVIPACTGTGVARTTELSWAGVRVPQFEYQSFRLSNTLENWEYELRRGLIPKKSGVVRLLAYTNCANMAIYRQATNHPWHITPKYGFGLNLEENLTHNLTAFGRFGLDNGKTESFAYTEVDQTFEEGTRRERANPGWMECRPLARPGSHLLEAQVAS